MKLNDILTRHGVGIGPAEEKPDDPTGSPGPNMLMYGDMEAGFFGTVPSSEMMDKATLALELGVTRGSARNPDSDWFKFASGGKIIFRTMKGIRYQMQETYQNALRNNWQSKEQIQFNGINYQHRFMRGLADEGITIDAREDNKTKQFQEVFNDSEWMRLIPPLSKEAKNNSWTRTAQNEFLVPNGTEFWPHDGVNGYSYTDWDIETMYKEMLDYGEAKFIGKRGGEAVNQGYLAAMAPKNILYIQADGPINMYSGHGWWPVLEVIQ